MHECMACFFFRSQFKTSDLCPHFVDQLYMGTSDRWPSSSLGNLSPVYFGWIYGVWLSVRSQLWVRCPGTLGTKNPCTTVTTPASLNVFRKGPISGLAHTTSCPNKVNLSNVFFRIGLSHILSFQQQFHHYLDMHECMACFFFRSQFKTSDLCPHFVDQLYMGTSDRWPSSSLGNLSPVYFGWIYGVWLSVRSQLWVRCPGTLGTKNPCTTVTTPASLNVFRKGPISGLAHTISCLSNVILSNAFFRVGLTHILGFQQHFHHHLDMHECMSCFLFESQFKTSDLCPHFVDQLRMGTSDRWPSSRFWKASPVYFGWIDRVWLWARSQLWVRCPGTLGAKPPCTTVTAPVIHISERTNLRTCSYNLMSK